MKNNANLNSENYYEKLTDKEKNVLQDWIFVNFEIAERFNLTNSSYNLKHLFENSPEGFYITNGQFKGAMLNGGYKVKDKNQLNWHFNVSKRSVKAVREKVYPS